MRIGSSDFFVLLLLQLFCKFDILSKLKKIKTLKVVVFYRFIVSTPFLSKLGKHPPKVKQVAQGHTDSGKDLSHMKTEQADNMKTLQRQWSRGLADVQLGSSKKSQVHYIRKG